MIDRTPYTYLIGWPELNRWYYGVRYAEGCDPSDLWKTYFTSSEYVADFFEQHGPPTVIKVHKTFDTVDEARQFESKMLKRMKVRLKEQWLNKHDNISVDPTCLPKGEDHWTQKDDIQYLSALEQMSGDNHWTRKDTESAKKHSEDSSKRSTALWSGDNNPSRVQESLGKKSGDKHWIRQDTEEAKQHKDFLSERWTGNKNPSKDTEKMEKRKGDGHWTKDDSEETRKALKTMSDKASINNSGENNNQYGKKGKEHPAFGTKRKRVICEHCNKDVATNVYAFAHGEKCKQNKQGK